MKEGSGDDVLFWQWENNGIYTVKSGYKLLQAQKNEWRLSDEASIWKILWRIKAPPQTLNLVWRALTYCLPTLVQLQQKHVNVGILCPVCSMDIETVEHAIFLCPFAVKCWSVLNNAIKCETGLNVSQWLENTLVSSNKEHRAEVVTLCWAIWRARNEKVWNKKTSTVNRVMAEANQYLIQWKMA